LVIAVVAKILFILQSDSEIIADLCVALQFDALGSLQLEIGCRSG
jgi:hypothetical protein